MRYKKRRGKAYRLFIRVIIILLILFIGFLSLFEYKARDLVHNTVDNEFEIHAMNAIDDAVAEVLSQEIIDYESLIITGTAQDGSVNSLHTNTAAVNILKSKLSREITEKIRQDKFVNVGVPVGAFTGLVLLSSLGPDIRIKLNLNGSVTTTIKSELTSAGINQTMHRIYLLVDADVSLTCPIISYETNFVSEYELCQTVIVGNTPNMFANIS